MAALGALSQAWVTGEASLPHGWSITGLWRFGDEWIALSEGPDRDIWTPAASTPSRRCAA